MVDQLDAHSELTHLLEKPSIETASVVMASPDHPEYTADKAVAIEIAGGKSGIIAAIDGVGSGGKKSEEAAEIVAEKLRALDTQFIQVPKVDEAVTALKNAFFDATGEIKDLQKATGNKSVDTTASVGVLCESADGKGVLVTANVGDSRIYQYNPRLGTIRQLTTDHSFVDMLVEKGLITPEEALTHPRRSMITLSVAVLKTPDEIDITIVPVIEGEIYLAVSDGVSDNIPPEELPTVVKQEYQKAYDPLTKKTDLEVFAREINKRAHNIMSKKGDSKHAKPDDSCVAVLKTKMA